MNGNSYDPMSTFESHKTEFVEKFFYKVLMMVDFRVILKYMGDDVMNGNDYFAPWFMEHQERCQILAGEMINICCGIINQNWVIIEKSNQIPSKYLLEQLRYSL